MLTDKALSQCWEVTTQFLGINIYFLNFNAQCSFNKNKNNKRITRDTMCDQHEQSREEDQPSRWTSRDMIIITNILIFQMVGICIGKGLMLD